jgi:citrate-Mg2+:H+ or citrate-Ca2+:H+ symporter, CitMHS family
MLITLGFSMIAVFMYLILSKRLTPMVALILVPLTFAVLAGAFGVTGEAEEGVVDSIMTGNHSGPDERSFGVSVRDRAPSVC